MGVKRSVSGVVRVKRWVMTGCQAAGKALMDWLNDNTAQCGGNTVPGPIVLYAGRGQASRTSASVQSVPQNRVACQCHFWHRLCRKPGLSERRVCIPDECIDRVRRGPDVISGRGHATKD
jgi:hypothetical protein